MKIQQLENSLAELYQVTRELAIELKDLGEIEPDSDLENDLSFDSERFVAGRGKRGFYYRGGSPSAQTPSYVPRDISRGGGNRDYFGKAYRLY